MTPRDTDSVHGNSPRLNSRSPDHDATSAPFQATRNESGGEQHLSNAIQDVGIFIALQHAHVDHRPLRIDEEPHAGSGGPDQADPACLAMAGDEIGSAARASAPGDVYTWIDAALRTWGASPPGRAAASRGIASAAGRGLAARVAGLSIRAAGVGGGLDERATV